MRPHEDYMVDRLGVQAQQCVELTNTNWSNGLTTFFFRQRVEANQKVQRE